METLDIKAYKKNWIMEWDKQDKMIHITECGDPDEIEMLQTYDYIIYDVEDLDDDQIEEQIKILKREQAQRRSTHV